MTRFAYFPGCSGEGSGCEYVESVDDVLRALGHELEEIPDWNCCGASSAHSVSEYLSLALPGRDLVKAEEMGLDVIAPCAACYNRLARAAKVLTRTQAMDGEELPRFTGSIRVRHPVRILAEPDVLTQVKGLVKQPLAGLKVVPYYGCLLVRPGEVTELSGSELEDPMWMDRLLQALGAEVLTWSHKTSCCGAAQAMPRPDITQRLTMKIVEGARAAGAEAVVTACPLCFLNLEIQQLQAAEREGAKRPLLPAFYFSELMAVGMRVGRPKRAFKAHMIPVQDVLAGRQLSWQ